jgi:hypothetical protein
MDIAAQGTDCIVWRFAKYAWEFRAFRGQNDGEQQAD